MEEKARAEHKHTGYSRKRLAWYLWREGGPVLSPHIIRHILPRQAFTGRKKRRKTLYPARCAWEEAKPFTPAQVDMNDILDKATLGTRFGTTSVRHAFLATNKHSLRDAQGPVSLGPGRRW
ncbi:hypothetical protein [Candidatus Hadarchaeum sp.]|uniref:hypothetical protein n=1 Tax=Candidatus Hadarchaeum sp. TaxID=2883567 RepID=UPI00319DE87A